MIQTVIQPGEVDIWRVWLDQGPEIIRDLGRVLSPQEVNRSNRFRYTRDRNRWIAVRGALRWILGTYLHVNPRGIRISLGEHGKPELQDYRGALAFNISHSDDLALIALASADRVGIDIEHMRDDAAIEEIWQRSFAFAEQQYLCTLPQSQRMRAFFRIWSRREALVKATGLGLSLAPESIIVGTHSESKMEITLSLGTEPSWWTLMDISSNNYAAALAIEGPLTSLKIVHFDAHVTTPTIVNELVANCI